MAYTVIIGIILGQLICRLTYCRYVGLFDWTPKLFNYIFVPLIVSFHYWLMVGFLTDTLRWGVHYMVGTILGIVLQHFIIKIRKSYYRELFSYEEKRESQRTE